MKILILGGAGFLGKKLALALLKEGKLMLNGDAPKLIQKLVLFDQILPSFTIEDDRLECITGDIGDGEHMKKLLERKFDVIFYLAAIVSGEAERNFDLGMQVNLHSGLQLLELCRILDQKTMLVFASSCAVFGGDLPYVVEDQTSVTPQSSYGTQKAVMELLINDYSRKGFLDGRTLRLPTIVVRPGKPNAATSSFASSIIREPLHGQRAICPVGMDTEMWILSPRKAIDNFIHATSIKEKALGKNRIISLPGLTVSIKEMVQSLRVIAGPTAVDLIDWAPDPFIQSIVLTWPSRFLTERAEQLGFQKDISMTDIIEVFIDEELKR